MRYRVYTTHPLFRDEKFDTLEKARNRAANAIEHGHLMNHAVEVVVHDNQTDEAEFWTLDQDCYPSCQQVGHITKFANHLKAEF